MGPLLFLVYINDIDEAISTNILKFADDTKVFSVVASQRDINKLQGDLRNLCKWSKEWLMLFNIKKCILDTIIVMQFMKWIGKC